MVIGVVVRWCYYSPLPDRGMQLEAGSDAIQFKYCPVELNTLSNCLYILQERSLNFECRLNITFGVSISTRDTRYPLIVQI